MLLLLAAGVGWLMVSGALDGHWYDFRDLGIPMAHLKGWLDEQTAVQPEAVTRLEAALTALSFDVRSQGAEPSGLVRGQ